MSKFLTFLTFFCIVQLITSTEYPSDLERCHAGDTVCLVRTFNSYMHVLKNGRSDINIVPLDPLFIKELHIVQGSESPVNLNLRLRDINLHGLSNTRVKKVVGFGKDPATSKFEFYVRIKEITLIGKYSVRGNVLILPVVGSGPVNLTLINVDAALKFIPRVEIRDGKEYLQVSELKFSFKTKRLYMEFSDLFNGNSRLSQGTNRFVNDNWSVILNELKPALRKALGEIFRKEVSPFFAKFPYKDLFL